MPGYEGISTGGTRGISAGVQGISVGVRGCLCVNGAYWGETVASFKSLFLLSRTPKSVLYFIIHDRVRMNTSFKLLFMISPS